MEPSLDTGSGDAGGAPLVVVLDSISPGEGPLGVVEVDDGAKLAVGLRPSQPAPHDIYDFIP